jgi:hypothetical protein
MTYVSRQEMDERARRRTMEDRAAAHHYPRVPARTTDAVVNWLIDVRREINAVRCEIDELRADIDGDDGTLAITGLESRIEELEAQIG